MSDGENSKPVNVDPRCIQEALRTFFLPIKNDDPQLDFYTMYKRETMEYDTEYMKKYNEDLNTTLIFAGLFSAVSSTFVVDIQSKLEPDSNERSEAYLRAILLTLNRSLIPGEAPAVPPAWNGPPAEIITTLDLLYASLLMSLLAAFVAMLGKQWLNRYLRHAGGSVVERCGDCQRKFDGLEKWPFRLFVESLPIILQIALFLLACGLSRYMWSVNTSVTRVVISFTVLSILFYFGIIIAGTSSYECPFQTPASMTLRYLRDSGATLKNFTSLSPPNVISVIHITRRNVRKLLADLSLPNTTSLIYAVWMDARQGLVSTYRRARDVTQPPFSWEILLSHVMSGIRGMATKIGHQTIILLLQIDRRFLDAKQGLAYRIRRFRRTGLLPIAVTDAHRQPLSSQNSPGLQVPVRNLESIQKQNANNARCVSWVLRNITDPEAIDSAIRLAGTIRWFDGDSSFDPPFDLIVPIFEACFDSAKQLYPGMRDRAYSSARAILRINVGARTRCRGCASSKYPIPAVSSSSFQNTDPDLHNILRMLELNSGSGRPTLCFPKGGTNTNAHLLWMSNLFVDLTRVGPNPTLKSYWLYLSVATNNHQPTIANTLLVWYMLLGGRVEEETFWAVDKSDSLEAILSYLSTRVMDIILDGDFLEHLYYLLEFLAAWEKRPAHLAPIAYQWCSAISEAAGRESSTFQHFLRDKVALGHKLKIRLDNLCPRPNVSYGLCHGCYGLRLRLGRGPTLAEDYKFLSPTIKKEFSEVGPGCDLLRLGDAFRCPCGCSDPTPLAPLDYAQLLSLILEIGFRLKIPCRHETRKLNRASHHDWMFEIAFSSDDDEVIADAVHAWIRYDNCTPPGSCLRYFTKCMEKDTPFSPRLRWASISAIEHIWESKLKVPVSDTVHLLDRLNVDVDDGVGEYIWGRLLVDVICSPGGLEGLSPHYWRLLDRLVSSVPLDVDSALHTAGVMKSLEEAEDWEKLETWTVVALQSQPLSQLENIGQVVCKLLLRRPSALPRFEDLCEMGILQMDQKDELRRICDRARTEQSPSESLPPQLVHIRPLVPLPFARDDTF